MNDRKGLNISLIHMGFFYSGGGERTVLSQAIGLAKLGHNVKIYAPTVSNDCFPELTKNLDITELCEGIPSKFPLRNAIGMITSSILIQYDKFKDSDLILAHGQPSSWIAYKINKKLRIPYCVYLHQVNRFFKPRKVDKEKGWNTDKNLALLSILHKNNKIVKKLDEVSVKNATSVFTNSKWIQKMITEYYHVNSQVCYPGVDVENFKSRKNDFPIKYILTTNRHYPQKRIDYLLKCMRKIVDEIPDVNCIITGETTAHTQELVTLRNKLDLNTEVIFTNKVSSKALIDLYQRAYSYAYTSPEEDFGLGPVEAGACGVPSIVWDHAGPCETVLHEKTGFRVKPYNVDLMAKYHIYLFQNEDRRNKMGQESERYVNSKFTWTQHCEKLSVSFENIYDSIK